MKKLALLLVASLLFIGCGSTQNDQPVQPELVASIVNNNDGTATISWSATDPTTTKVEIRSQSADGILLSSSNQLSGSADVFESAGPQYAVVSYAPVKTTIIFLTILPGPPSTKGLVDITVSWALPTVYADGTLIETDNVAKLVVQIYWNTLGVFTDPPDITQLLLTSTPGSTQATVYDVEVFWSVTYYFSARTHINPDGLWSAPSPPVSHIWAAP